MHPNKFPSLSPTPSSHPSLSSFSQSASMSPSPATPNPNPHQATALATDPPPPAPVHHSPNAVVSPTGMIHVLGYTPTEGECGVPITVRIHFHPDIAEAIYVRLVIGSKAVATKVRELPGTTYGRWQLDATAPPLDDNTASAKVVIAVQALNESDIILDSVTFGEFSYWTPQPATIAPPVEYGVSKHTRSKDTKLPPLTTNGPALRRRSIIQLGSPTSTSTKSARSKTKDRKTKLHRRLKSQSLVRSKYGPNGENEDLYLQTPILELVTPLSSLCVGWTPVELNAGRRLVRFGKIQEGRRLIVSCEPIPQEDYCESDSVISCIYREETKNCFVTSVDIIYLLERLTNDEFPVEEKNRIRRNLEGLRPTTVSKHKVGFEDFFQRIMEFPDPKPRNIEKDLKVFEWTLLGQALEKILSKYVCVSSPSSASSPASNSSEAYLQSIYTSLPDSGDSEQSSNDGNTSSPKSPELIAPTDYGQHTNFPDTATNNATDAMSKLGVSPETSLLFTADGEGPYSAAPSGIVGVSPAYLHDPRVPHWSTAAGAAASPTGFKPDIAFDNYGNLATFDTIDSGALSAFEPFSDHATYSLPYDHYTYQAGMQDDTLASIVDPSYM
ncbi:hypothetical protein AX16_007006 [Volvariella volvacea WC 439]|nr:hypothetical protein AX16_007006 [Volvariella volvacea WC 439]